jgi:hypothetical protein
VALARPPLDLIRGRKEMEMRFSHSADSSTSPACSWSGLDGFWSKPTQPVNFFSAVWNPRVRRFPWLVVVTGRGRKWPGAAGAGNAGTRRRRRSWERRNMAPPREIGAQEDDAAAGAGSAVTRRRRGSWERRNTTPPQELGSLEHGDRVPLCREHRGRSPVANKVRAHRIVAHHLRRNRVRIHLR